MPTNEPPKKSIEDTMGRVFDQCEKFSEGEFDGVKGSISFLRDEDKIRLETARNHFLFKQEYSHESALEYLREFARMVEEGGNDPRKYKFPINDTHYLGILYHFVQVKQRGREAYLDTDKGNLFQRNGNVWYVKFNHFGTNVNDSYGMEYLAYLLGQPKEFISAAKLGTIQTEASRITSNLAKHENSESNSSEEDKSKTGSIEKDKPKFAEPIQESSEEAIKQVKAAIKKLDDEHRTIVPGTNPEREKEIEQEISKCEKYLGSVCDNQGKPRKLLPDKDRTRVRITKAIREAIKNIKFHHKALGEHLEKNVKTGNNCSYNPPYTVEWNF